MEDVDKTTADGYPNNEGRKTGKKRVVVIGAGIAGLFALRHFGDDPAYEVVAYEVQNRLGGVWNYPEGCEAEPYAPLGSDLYCRMYQNMRSNAPRDLNQFPEMKLENVDGSYPSMTVMFDYVQNYAKKFNLRQHIKFRHRVTSVEPLNSTKSNVTDVFSPWKVTVLNTATNVTFTDTCDFLIVCNGRHEKPYIPTIPGIDAFKGSIIHSSAYRSREHLRGKTVLLIGRGPSGNDIACQLLSIAKQIIVCHNRPTHIYKQFPQVTETSGSSISFTQNGIILPDGSEIAIDQVIFCTGFEMSLPFLADSCGLEVTRGRVYPLYRHFINCHYPSMAIVGLLGKIPYLIAGPEMQIRYYKAVADGKIQLPTSQQMIADTGKEIETRAAEGLKMHDAHVMAHRLFPYISQLAEAAGLEKHEPVLEKMWSKHLENFLSAPYDYRNYRFDRMDPENFTTVRGVPSSLSLDTDIDVPSLSDMPRRTA